jgi:hypothetical protein
VRLWSHFEQPLGQPDGAPRATARG